MARTARASTGRRGPGPVVRAARGVGRGAAQFAVVAVGVWWLVPTVGLGVASLRSPADNSDTGWWTVLGAPTRLTLRNYRGLLADDRITHALWNTVLISVPATVLVVAIGAVAAYPLACGSGTTSSSHSSSPAPITSVLQAQMRSFPSNIDVIAPGALVSMAAPLLVFFLFQRFFLHSMLAGTIR